MEVIEIVPDIGVPYRPSDTYVDLKARADAACNTALALETYGLDIDFGDIDAETAATLVTTYAENPQLVSHNMSQRKSSSLTPASMILVSTILKEFSHNVAKSATDIRHLVTNKLIIESDHADARIRLRAMELLGKISDVALFTEKVELTSSDKASSNDLRAKLKEKLHRLIDESEEDSIVDVVPNGE